MGSSVPDEPTRELGQPDAEVEAMLRDAGHTVTEAGRVRWRQRLAMPIPAAALAEVSSMRARPSHGRAA